MSYARGAYVPQLWQKRHATTYPRSPGPAPRIIPNPPLSTPGRAPRCTVVVVGRRRTHGHGPCSGLPPAAEKSPSSRAGASMNAQGTRAGSQQPFHAARHGTARHGTMHCMRRRNASTPSLQEMKRVVKPSGCRRPVRSRLLARCRCAAVACGQRIWRHLLSSSRRSLCPSRRPLPPTLCLHPLDISCHRGRCAPGKKQKGT
jgi:hypothetical protein